MPRRRERLRAVCPSCGRVVSRAKKFDLLVGYKMRSHNSDHGVPCPARWSRVDYLPPSKR